MDDVLSFGIGCFHFGVARTPPFKFEGSEYIENLRTCIQSISNVDEISISCDEEFSNLSFDVSEELPHISNGLGFFPQPNFMNVEFELHIPFRIQAQLLEERVALLRTFTEQFKVSIHYTYHLPVTFVESVNPSQKNSPSEGVQIVREFLKQEFASSKSDYIRFEFLGPSPFHVDCYIQSGGGQCSNEVDWKFQTQRICNNKGYDDIIFNFNQNIFAEAAEAKDVIMEEIEDELGFFYDIVQSEVEKIVDWERLQDTVTKLVSNQRMKGIKGICKRVFLRSKLINNVFTDLAEFESKDICFQNITERDYRDIYLDRKDEHFQSYVEKQMKERFRYPTEKTAQLIRFFESRRVKSVEVFVVLISAILGGAIGALLTILLSK